MRDLILVSTLCIFWSCKRAGCRDSEALNYDAKAEVSDHTCLFNSRGIVYWEQSNQVNLMSNGTTHLTIVFRHDTLYKQTPLDSFGPFNNIDCKSADWIQFNEVTYDDDYEVGIIILNQDNDTLLADIIEFEPGCNLYKIEFY